VVLRIGCYYRQTNDEQRLGETRRGPRLVWATPAGGDRGAIKCDAHRAAMPHFSLGTSCYRDDEIKTATITTTVADIRGTIQRRPVQARVAPDDKPPPGATRVLDRMNTTMVTQWMGPRRVY